MFTDVHIGKHHSNNFYMDLDKKVIDIIVERSKNDIDQLIFLGDLVHTRGEIHQKALDMVRYYLDKLNNIGIPVKMILGNHDLLYEKNKSVNYFNVFDGLFKNIEFITDMKQVDNMLYVGWLQNDKELQWYRDIEEDYEFIFGHFEFKDTKLNEKYKTDFGVENNNKKSMIFSGHYHGRTIQDNLYYIGTPYPSDWGHKNNDSYGLCILDTKTKKVKFEDLDLFHYRELKMTDVIYNLLTDVEVTRKLFTGNEVIVIPDDNISPKKLYELRLLLNSFEPKNLVMEPVLQFNSEDKIKYDNIILSSPDEFINNYINELTLEEEQKKRIKEKVETIMS